MPARRMNRDQFFAKLAMFDEEGVKKALWNLYWRGSAPMRERIEAEVDRDAHDRRQAERHIDPDAVLDEVREFVELARSGAYLGGDRRVSPREKTRWRFTFRRLVTAAEGALDAEDVQAGAAAMEQLIDLACATRDFDYFRSDDPVEAARFVVSDAAALLWGKLRERYGFAGFADRAAPQLIRWESQYGWTRRGDGRVSKKETSLANVLAQMLRAPDMWISFAERYLEALDDVAGDNATRTKHPRPATEWKRKQRTGALAEWHSLLLDRLAHREAEGGLVRLTKHPALAGPDLTFLQTRLTSQRAMPAGPAS